MAKLATVPDGVLLVREDDRMNPRQTRLNGKVLPGLHRRPLDGYAFHKIDRLDFPFTLRGFPIYAIGALREFGGERLVVVFPDALLAQGMAAGALLSVGVIGAGSKDRFPLE